MNYNPNLAVKIKFYDPGKSSTCKKEKSGHNGQSHLDTVACHGRVIEFKHLDFKLIVNENKPKEELKRQFQLLYFWTENVPIKIPSLFIDNHQTAQS